MNLTTVGNNALCGKVLGSVGMLRNDRGTPDDMRSTFALTRGGFLRLR